MGKGYIGDFLSFWIDDTHSSDLGLTRVSDGSRYTKTLLPSFKDETAEVPGGDGTYYYGSRYEKKEIPIKVAFDDLSESQFRQITQLIGDKQMHRLVFDEEPYKEYVVKIAAPPEFKYLCFDEVEDYEDENEETKQRIHRVYKGEGELKFVCYDGYARNRTGYKWLEDYDIEVFSNKNEWIEALNIPSKNFGWKILVGNEQAEKGETVEIPFIIEDKISSIIHGTTLSIFNIYQVILRDGDLVDNELEDGGGPIYHKIITKPSIVSIPGLGKRLGIEIEEDAQHGKCFIFNDKDEIKIWIEDEKSLPWKGCFISIYRLLYSDNGFDRFDEFVSMSSSENQKTAYYYANNIGDIETSFKIKIYSTYIPPMKIYLNNVQILETKEIFTDNNSGGIQINSKTHLIEEMDDIGLSVDKIHNNKILMSNFRNLPVGENFIVIEINEIQPDMVFGLNQIFLEYTNYYL